MAGGSVGSSQVKSSWKEGTNYTQPLILVTSLFFMWAIALNLNDILIPHLKKACDLTDFQSSLIQSAFFGAYFLAAYPAGKIMKKLGYKKGIILGLILCSLGALIFYPAADTRIYAMFLFALFVMATGACFLEVAANPYVTVLGNPATAANRLNLAQSFNAVGAVLTPQIGKNFILSGIELKPEEMALMTANELEKYRIYEASMVKMPYLIIAGIFALIAAFIAFSKLPEIEDAEDESTTSDGTSKSIWQHGHLIKGVIAQFFYVGAQVGVASFIIRFMQFLVPGTSETSAADYLFYHLIGFLIGRFAGTALMKKIEPAKLLSIFAVASAILAVVSISTSGMMAIWAIVGLGFFHSIMFPTIFALSIKNLGGLTKTGSSIIVMSIVGGAIFPAVMGLLSDAKDIQFAFIVPLVCYIYILYYGISGNKVKTA